MLEESIGYTKGWLLCCWLLHCWLVQHFGLPVFDCQDTKRQSAGNASDLLGFSTRLCPSCPAMWGTCRAAPRVLVQGPRAKTTAVAGTSSPFTVTPATTCNCLCTRVSAKRHLHCICAQKTSSAVVASLQHPDITDFNGNCYVYTASMVLDGQI